MRLGPLQEIKTAGQGVYRELHNTNSNLFPLTANIQEGPPNSTHKTPARCSKKAMGQAVL